MIYIASLLFGLTAGSLAGVCIHRLPRGLSLWRPRSHCPRCSRPLRWYDNIPLGSFMILQGRCRFCHRPIPWKYPLVEIAMAFLFLADAWRFKEAIYRLVATDVLSFYLFTISVIDYDHKIIPDQLSLSLWASAIGFSFWNPFLGRHGWHSVIESLLAGFSGALVMTLLAWIGEKIFKKEALGGGDIKLIGALGALLGWDGLVSSLTLGSLLGGLIGILLLFLKLKKRRDTLPFGPFLSLGAYVGCFFPDWWVHFIFP